VFKLNSKISKKVRILEKTEIKVLSSAKRGNLNPKASGLR